MQTCTNSSLQQASPKMKISFQWAKDRMVLHLQTASPFRTPLCAISVLETQPFKTGNMQLRGYRHKGFGFTTSHIVPLDQHQGHQLRKRCSACLYQLGHAPYCHMPKASMHATQLLCVASPVLRGSVSHKNRLSFAFTPVPCSSGDWL